MPRYHGQCRPVNPEPGTSVSRFGVAEPVNGTRLGPIAAAFVAKRTSVRVVGHGPSDLSQDADRENAGDSSVAVVRFENLAAGYVFLDTFTIGGLRNHVWRCIRFVQLAERARKLGYDQVGQFNIRTWVAL